jgi:hypothetical protein
MGEPKVLLDIGKTPSSYVHQINRKFELCHNCWVLAEKFARVESISSGSQTA